MYGPPPADEFLETFDGRIYGPIGRGKIVLTQDVGWSSDGDGVSSLRLKFLLGARQESVIVEVSRRPESRSPQRVLHELLFEATMTREPRFPIVIERGKVRIPVEGRERAFTTYTSGPAAVAAAWVKDRSVVIRCSTSRLRQLTLGLVEPAELRRVRRNLARSLREQSKRWRKD